MFFVLTLPPCVILGQNQVPVLLNYQQIQYMPDDIEIGVAYAGSCRSLVAQAFNRTAIIDQTFDSPMNFSAVKNTIKIARHSLEQSGNEAMYLRLVAQNGTLTCSNADTPDVFYHFSPLGMQATASLYYTCTIIAMHTASRCISILHQTMHALCYVQGRWPDSVMKFQPIAFPKKQLRQLHIHKVLGHPKIIFEDLYCRWSLVLTQAYKKPHQCFILLKNRSQSSPLIASGVFLHAPGPLSTCRLEM